MTPLKSRRPTSAAQRHMTVADTSHLTKKRPEKRLTRRLKNTGGRDRRGRVSVRHIGGGSRHLYRVIDFKQMDRMNETATVIALEYDPNRTAYIALIQYPDGTKRYMLAPAGLAIGHEVKTVEKGEAELGYRMPLAEVPTGIAIHNIALRPNQKGILVRSAGQSATVVAKDATYVLVRLPSGELRNLHRACYATIGSVSFPEHKDIVYAKAGRIRKMGIRPTVRGKAMNVHVHPHGGGEGRSPIGLKYPKTPWGKPALGVPTRKNKRSDRFIVKRRGKGRS